MDKEALFWDYKEHSHIKERERIGLFFPQIGRDKETIIELYYDLIKKGEIG